MTELTLGKIQERINGWLQRERDGEQFPVDFEQAWQIPSYQKRQNALINVENNLIEGEEFLPKSVKNPGRGRSKRSFTLSCDGFKQFCLLARTETGRQIRQYFIECEKNWRMIQEKQGTLAEDIELEKLKLQSQILDQQLANKQLDHTLLSLHGVANVLAMRGYRDQVVEVEKPTVEVIDQKHNVSFRGQTLKQIADHLKKTFGIEFKSGTALKRYLEENNAGHLIAQTPRSVLQDYVPEDHLEQVYSIAQSANRQLLLGE